VLYDGFNGARNTAHAAGDFIFGIYLYYYFGGTFHKAIVAAWALLIISLAAVIAEQLAALISIGTF